MNFNILYIKELLMQGLVYGVGIIMVDETTLNFGKITVFNGVINSFSKQGVIYKTTHSLPYKVGPTNSSLSKSTSNISLNSVKLRRPVEKNELLAPLKESAKPVFENRDKLINFLSKAYRIGNQYILENLSKTERITLYYNPSKNKAVVSGMRYSPIQIIKETDDIPFLIIKDRGRNIKPSIVYAEGSAYDYLRLSGTEVSGNNRELNKTGAKPYMNPKFSVSEGYGTRSLLSKIFSKSSSNEVELNPFSSSLQSESTIIKPYTTRVRDEILTIDGIQAGKPLLEYVDTWVPIIYSASEEASFNHSKSDVHLFTSLKISNGLGSGLYSVGEDKALIELYGRHIFRNPTYYRSLKLSRPIYKEPTDLFELTSKAQQFEWNISNRTAFNEGQLVVTGVFVVENFNGIVRLVTHSRSQIGGLVSKQGNESVILYNDYNLPVLNIDNGGRLKVIEGLGENISFFQQNRNKLVEYNIISNEWYKSGYYGAYESEAKLSSRWNNKTVIAAFVEYPAPTGTELKPSIFPLFEDLNLSNLKIGVGIKVRHTNLNLSTTIDGNKTRQLVPYDRLLVDRGSSMTMDTYVSRIIEVSFNDLVSKNIKGTVGLIPKFIDRNELNLVSEQIYSKMLNYSSLSNIPFLEISPVALYNPLEHRVAILNSSNLGRFFKSFASSNIISNDKPFIGFPNGIAHADISLFSRDRFSLLMRESSSSVLEEVFAGYVGGNGVLNAKEWTPLFIQVGYGKGSIASKPVISLFKDIILLSREFSNRIDIFGRLFFFDIL